ncbi:MAG: HAD-IIA family hydrolase [Gammaproteobacteria bacterium]
MEPFTDIRALIIDMDGVLWHGDRPLPGLNEFFVQIRKRRLAFILATNNARLTPAQYVAKLSRMGVEVSSDDILTSGASTAMHLAERYDPLATKVFVIGENGLRQPLIDHGFTLIDPYRFDGGCAANPQADIVVSGLDLKLTWEKLATAALNIRAGADFYGTNGDTTLPTELGLTPGNGAVLAALQAATGVVPTTLGKPEPIMYRQAISLLKASPAETVAIGDRLDTDILGAVRANIRSLMVLTGVSTEKDLKASDYRPTWVLPDIRAVTKSLLQNR